MTKLMKTKKQKKDRKKNKVNSYEIMLIAYLNGQPCIVL